MSWQCSICETVNQDISPKCTVCDTLAPVIESFLSLESIECLREYNAKLNEIHRLEVSRDYDMMFDIALEAMAIYKENGIAVEKAKQALKRNNDILLMNQLKTLLNSSMDKKNYLGAIAVIEIIQYFNFEISDFTEVKSEIESKIAKEKDINDILKNSYEKIIQFQLEEASEIVECGLIKYPSSEFLQQRRNEIMSIKAKISSLQKKEDGKKKPYKPLKGQNEPIPRTTPQSTPKVISLGVKRTYPKHKK